LTVLQIHDDSVLPAPATPLRGDGNPVYFPGSTNGKERFAMHWPTDGIELIVPDWFYQAVNSDDALISLSHRP